MKDNRSLQDKVWPWLQLIESNHPRWPTTMSKCQGCGKHLARGTNPCTYCAKDKLVGLGASPTDIDLFIEKCQQLNGAWVGIMNKARDAVKEGVNDQS